MKDWVATTEKGKVYVFRHGILRVVGNRHTAIKALTVQSSTRPDNQVDLVLPWQDASAWEEVEMPVVGRRVYIGGLREWRISTDIVKVEEWKPFAYDPEHDGRIICIEEARWHYQQYRDFEGDHDHVLTFDEWAAVHLDTEVPEGGDE